MSYYVESDAAALIARLAYEQARRNHAAIEQACEAALQGGRYGVRVTRNGDSTVTAEVHPDVPFGTIHEYVTPPASPFGPLDGSGHDGHAPQLNGLLADCPGCVTSPGGGDDAAE